MIAALTAACRPLRAAGVILGIVVSLCAVAGNADDYPWQLPRGFPVPLVPADNPMSVDKVALGEKLFHDRRLSRTGEFACASCHDARRAFTDGRAVAQGAMGDALRRSAMSLANVAYNAGFNWADTRVISLESQMQQPLFGEHPIELGMKGREADVLAAFARDEDYTRRFAAAFPSPADSLTLDNVVRAIASYERSLFAGDSPFDRYVFHDEHTALDSSARRGMTLFFSERSGCSHCHSGINFSGPVRVAGAQNAQAIYANTGLYNVDGRGGYPVADTGLREVTGRRTDDGRFRVPTLRNVAITAPYMHDGSIATLAQVLEHYDAGGRAPGPNPLRDRHIRPLALGAQDKRDLLAFLHSLTDRRYLPAGETQAIIPP